MPVTVKETTWSRRSLLARDQIADCAHLFVIVDFLELECERKIKGSDIAAARLICRLKAG
jgi:hypothetical protein